MDEAEWGWGCLTGKIVASAEEAVAEALSVKHAVQYTVEERTADDGRIVFEVRIVFDREAYDAGPATPEWAR